MIGSIITGVAGAIEGVSNALDGITSWLRQKERDQLIRKSEDADDLETLLRNHEDAMRARARRKYDKLLDGARDPADRSNWSGRD